MLVLPDCFALKLKGWIKIIQISSCISLKRASLSLSRSASLSERNLSCTEMALLITRKKRLNPFIGITYMISTWGNFKWMSECVWKRHSEMFVRRGKAQTNKPLTITCKPPGHNNFSSFGRGDPQYFCATFFRLTKLDLLFASHTQREKWIKAYFLYLGKWLSSICWWKIDVVNTSWYIPYMTDIADINADQERGEWGAHAGGTQRGDSVSSERITNRKIPARDVFGCAWPSVSLIHIFICWGSRGYVRHDPHNGSIKLLFRIVSSTFFPYGHK